MSDLMMFLIVGSALGVLALLSFAMWIWMLHKSHTEWRLAADNGRLASSVSNDSMTNAQAAGATGFHRRVS
jgi:hypothetical protein